MINDSCQTGPTSSTNCEPVRPRLITPQEMLADLNYKLDTQFEVLYADNEEVMKKMIELSQKAGDHSDAISEILRQLERTKEKQSMQAKFFDSMSISIEKLAAEQNKETSEENDQNANAYQQHLKRLTERARRSEANILQEMDKTFDVVKATSDG